MIQVNGIAGASPTPRGVKKLTGSAVNGGSIDNFEDIVDDIIVNYVDDEVCMMMRIILMIMVVMIYIL